jgi:predicted AAA+ superfamily ATPase
MRDFWFWRDSAGHEVDLIIQDDEFLNVIEIKSTKTISKDLFKRLNFFQDLAKEKVKTNSLIYAGLENQKRSAGNVVSWYDLK